MSLVHLARLSYATIVPIAFRPVNYYPFRICCGQALSFGCLATYPFKCLLLGHALEIGRFAVKRRCCKVFGACSPHKLIFVSVEIWFPLFLGFFVDFLCLEFHNYRGVCEHSGYVYSFYPDPALVQLVRGDTKINLPLRPPHRLPAQHSGFFVYFLVYFLAAVNVLGQASSCGQPSVGQHYKYLSLPLQLTENECPERRNYCCSALNC